MHAASRIFLLVLALTGWTLADLPKKAPITRYTGLWTNSPFTSKPPPQETGPIVNPLEDYALIGISPIGAGYRVTMMNKKKPEERITVDSDNSKSNYKIVKVTRKEGNPLGTVVRMSSGAITGDVSFDEKLLVLATAPPAAPNARPLPAGAPPPGQPLQPGQAPTRQPRPRVVPPPVPTTGQQIPPRPQPVPTNRPIHRGGR